MPSLVLQLQADCLDSDIPLLDVLRKALVVARKLSLADAQTWIEKELGGYKSGDIIPPHRRLIAQIRTWNPYNACWMPMMFENSKEAGQLAMCSVGQAIGELESLVNSSSGSLEFPFPLRCNRP
jgi:hypothetical protein